MYVAENLLLTATFLGNIFFTLFFRSIIQGKLAHKPSLRIITIIIITIISIMTDTLHSSDFMLLWYYLCNIRNM